VKEHPVAISINGAVYEHVVEPRLLLSDFIRDRAGLTGTKVGCEHGICGTCTIQLDGRPVRSCLLLAVQANGRAVRTVEALAAGRGGELHPLQLAFHEAHALQCGFCTPGFLMSLEPLFRSRSERGLSDAVVRETIAGVICRCTGYDNIVRAARAALGIEPG
jgi:aerobic-type carbon monoxide dehydrogenase small subunit (CoxS/CutS family)